MRKLAIVLVASLALPLSAHAATKTNVTSKPGATATATVSTAKCRDAKGHFITCAKTETVTKTKMTPAGPVTKTATSTETRCRDSKGHFIKCVEKTKVTAPAGKMGATHCRDIKTGRFAKCGTPGSKPA